MLSYVIRRTLVAIPTLFVIITAAFFMMRIAPGGPFDSERHLPPEIERNIESAYNLDKPVYEQYFLYMDRLAHGDLGPSFKTRDFTVTQLIADGLPVSLHLGLTAMIVAILLGVLEDGLTVIGVGTNPFYIWVGIVIVFAMALNVQFDRLIARSRAR